jgi:hypothetical protein
VGHRGTQAGVHANEEEYGQQKRREAAPTAEPQTPSNASAAKD